jgi:hypothetical protein
MQVTITLPDNAHVRTSREEDLERALKRAEDALLICQNERDAWKDTAQQAQRKLDALSGEMKLRLTFTGGILTGAIFK